MELLQLRYFYESAVNESFSKTAKNHMVPLTTVSAAIKRLEAELDCRLFVRTSNRVYLSEAGKQFYESIRDMFANLDKAVTSLKPKQEEKPVRVLVLDMRLLVTEWVIRYRKLNPTAAVYMTMNRRGADLEKYDIVIDEECDRYPDWDSIHLGEHKLRFTCSDRNPIWLRQLKLCDLATEDFIAYEENGNLYRRLMKICKDAGFKPRLAALCNDAACHHQLLMANTGIALLKMHRRPPEGLRYLDVVDFDQTIRFAAYYRRNEENKRVEELADFLRREFAKGESG